MSEELKHYGVKGMKWGVRRYQNADGTLTSPGKKRYEAKDTDSSVTKKVKKDLSQMTGQQFRKKYQVSNTRYMKRVDRYGDPYMNSPLAKLGKRLDAEAKKNAERYINKAKKKETAIQKDIDSFKPFLKTGIKDKSGRLMLSPDDVSKSIKGLEKLKNNKSNQTEARVKELIEKYGDKYTITQTKDGYILKDGKDEWKVR